MMDLGILLHHAESTLYSGLTEILKQNIGYTSTQRLVQFLMSRLCVVITFMELRIGSLYNLENTKVCGHLQKPNRYVDGLRYRESEKSY